ncbi:MAG TPA: cytochrome c-type biogenesis CcmF C-terminal domain-containing protein, partial [Gaiellaceae bacterium]
MAELGRAALLVTLGLVMYALVAGAAGAHLGRRRLALSAQNALVAAFFSTLVASAVLLGALLRHDFSFTYVARTTSEDLPTAYTISAFWGGQEGSLLLWLLVLTGFGAAAVRLNRGWARDLIVWVVPVFAAVAVFFAFLLVAVASPFVMQAAPADGAGMTPSLQNPYMLAHPPLLYLGYVGLTVPFAFCLGALLAGRPDERWLVATRRWTLFAWTALGIGQLLGAHWAYVEVGWGGYYAWDPVENAALMPWLAATAFLHSVMVQEKRGILRVWNVLLVILAFSLSLFGTFLTRSGVVNSIHSFTQSSIGPWFLAFIALTVAISLAVVFWRLPLLRSQTRLESPVSREAAFLYNNLLLLALCLTILWGVVYPLISEAVRGEAVVLGRAYYDFFLRIFGLPLLLLMGIGPLIAWRRASFASLVTTFRWPVLAALATGAALLVLGAGSSVPGLVAYTFSAFVAATIVMEFARGTRARKALGASSWPNAFFSLLGRNRRRYGGYVVHASIVLLAVGIAGSSAFDKAADAKLRPGESMAVGDYNLRYEALDERQTSNATEIRAQLAVSRGDRDLGTLEAGKNAYTVEQQLSNEVG